MRKIFTWIQQGIHNQGVRQQSRYSEEISLCFEVSLIHTSREVR